MDPLRLSHPLAFGFAGFIMAPHHCRDPTDLLVMARPLTGVPRCAEHINTKALSSWGEQRTPEGFVGYLGAVTEHILTVGQGTWPPAAPTVRALDMGQQLEVAKETVRRQGLAPGAGLGCAGRAARCRRAAKRANPFSTAAFWEERAAMRFSDEGSVAVKVQCGRMTLQAAARLPELLSAGTAERWRGLPCGS